ncbi:hypothetical protein AB0M48_28505 [Lentzea sp. NPDC051208]|uniref:TolB family protein n=1 Tax=Lentzea sp. NPDC051208 TaxID=3154642 RepID=UPI00343DFCD2
MELSRRELLTRTGQAAAVATAASTLTIGTAAQAESGERVKLTQGTNISVSRSRDGRWLAIDLVTAIWVLPSTGGEARKLTDELQDASLPSFGPDGQIAFQSIGTATTTCTSSGSTARGSGNSRGGSTTTGSPRSRRTAGTSRSSATGPAATACTCSNWRPAPSRS